MMEEIRSGVDIHALNQERFGLPERVIAKTFVFRLIYGGQAYSYAHDPNFTHVSKSQKYWQGVIDEFYNKYRVINKWHEGLVRTVVNTGQLVMPTGRTFSFDQQDVIARNWYWRPKILNYPVQGTGADLVAIARVTMWKRLRKAGIPALFTSTVHDSIDIDSEVCYNRRVVQIIRQSVEDVPNNFERLFNVKFDLPLKCEIKLGVNLKETIDVTDNYST